MPTIAYNIKDTPVRFHWFLKNEVQVEKPEKNNGPSKREFDSLELSFKNEKERLYNLNGYTYKHTGEYYSPDEKDVGRLVAVVADTGIDHPVNAAISARAVIASPERIVTDEQVKWCRENSLKDNKNEVRVMCYNILADLYMNLNKPQEELFFKYCPKANQRVFYRTPIFLKQLRDFIDADVSIIFLQEVDMSRHENFIKPFLKTMNFSSIISTKVRQISEGVTVAFDEKKFRSIYSNSFALTDLAEESDANEDVRKILKSSDVSLERFSTRPTIVQIVMLESLENGTIFICANTHLHHNPLDEHIKALQALVCARKVMEVYKEKKNEEPTKNFRVLFAGDFNSTPDGPVFPLFSNGFLSKEDRHWNCDVDIVSDDLKIEGKLDCLTGTPEYTNFTADSQKEGFVGCLDYIWGIDVDAVRVCPMPPHETVIEYIGLPSVHSPSDHLPIICDIKL
uniref:Endo/exonuclease/phosphatase domain-containing protein n=1 Tax=Caenorhabditis tropicalis TaxID=1561998 RepID=A0A1I7TM52_9PELO